MHRTDKYSHFSSNIWSVWPNDWVFVYELSDCKLESRSSHLNFRYRVCFTKKFLDIQANGECGFTLKCVRNIIITYSQMHRTDNYSQFSSVIWSVWPNGWVFVYELSGCGFECRCSQLNSRYRTCFKQGVPWQSSKYRVWIRSEIRKWHDNNIQSNAPYR